ncbi:hypothetical protein V5E97_29455 [Singulisphaera sp. Ch08]|uniref:DUF3379 family protein n=1 Tax=Singulisphaera sp. Ch08 TaxID=3120278 RepID=A0AAU7CBF1_9BACT
MRLIAPDIPDDPAALPGWLDRHLVGLDLTALVAELEAVHGSASTPSIPLDQVLGDRRAEVLSQGLAVLPTERLRALLRHPRLLLDLQELILIEGGRYWQDLGPLSAEQQEVVERGRTGLRTFLTTEAGATTDGPNVLSFARPVRWYRRPWLISLATAASIVAAVVVYDKFKEPSTPVPLAIGWGWSRPGALPQDVPPATYLNRLADGADDWFAKRPEEPAALAKRITEFRLGCATLIAAEHQPLSADDRAWLIEKCRAWAAKLDEHLAAVEAGRDPLQVRAEADETIKKLIEALRERAKSVV